MSLNIRESLRGANAKENKKDRSSTRRLRVWPKPYAALSNIWILGGTDDPNAKNGTTGKWLGRGFALRQYRFLTEVVPTAESEMPMESVAHLLIAVGYAVTAAVSSLFLS